MDATAPRARRLRRPAIIGAIALALLAGIGAYALKNAVPSGRFVEYPLPNPQDAPVAIAAAADGTIWFTIDRAFRANEDPLFGSAARDEFAKLRQRIVNRLPAKVKRKGGKDRA